MEPPAHVCRALAQIDPNLRLVWLGRAYHADGRLPDTAPEDVAGTFGVLEIHRRRDIFDRRMRGIKASEPLYPRELRNRAGTVWGADGRPGRDWDIWTHQAVLICTCDYQWNMRHEDVYGTRFLDIMRKSRKTVRERKLQQMKEKEQRMRDRASKLGDAKEALAEGIKSIRAHTNTDFRMVDARKHAIREYEEEKENMAPEVGFKSRPTSRGVT